MVTLSYECEWIHAAELLAVSKQKVYLCIADTIRLSQTKPPQTIELYSAKNSLCTADAPGILLSFYQEGCGLGRGGWRGPRGVSKMQQTFGDKAPQLVQQESFVVSCPGGVLQLRLYGDNKKIVAVSHVQAWLAIHAFTLV